LNAGHDGGGEPPRAHAERPKEGGQMMRQVWFIVMGGPLGLVAMLAVAGCQPAVSTAPNQVTAPSPSASVVADLPTPTDPPDPRLLVSPDDPAEALTSGAFFDKGRQPITTGWEDTPERLHAAYCEGCHADTHSQWRQGLHSHAWDDPLFQEGFRKEERLWCVHCHAPLAAQRDQYLDTKRVTKRPTETTATTQTTEAATAYTPDSAPHALLDEGINCAACHVRGGHILGPRPSQNPAHPVVASAYLSSPTFCADCHQFNFPDFSQGHIGYTDSPMQDTLAEWRAASPGVTCAGCHYRDGHRLVGPHDVEWMRSKFKDFQYQARGPLLSVQFNVSARGHLVPSGDLFHSLSLEISQDPDFTTLYAQHKWARFFTKGVLEPGVIWDRALARNTGLLPKTRRVSLTLDMPPAGPTFIRLVYHYHDQALGGANPLPPEALRLVLWTAQAR
jgi:hypothetical protein